MDILTDSDLEGGRSPASAPPAAPQAQVMTDADLEGPAPQAPNPQPTPQPQASTPPPDGHTKVFSDSDLEGTAPAALPTPDQNSYSGKSRGQMAQDLKDALGQAAHGVGAVIEPLGIPLRWASYGVGKMLGAPDPGMGKVMGLPTPNGEFTDVAMFLADKLLGSDQEYLKKRIDYYQNQFAGTPQAAEAAHLAAQDLIHYKQGPAMAVGLAADWFMDPLRLVGVGAYTKATEEALQSGKLVSSAENAAENPSLYTEGKKAVVSLRAPFTNARAELTAEQVSNALDSLGPVGKGIKAAASTASDWASRMTQALDVHTGDPDIDRNLTLYNAEMRGNRALVLEQRGQPYRDRNITDPENDIVRTVTETTPNLRAELPGLGVPHPETGAYTVKYTEKGPSPMLPEEQAAVGHGYDQLREQVEAQVKQQAPNMDPARADTLVDHIMDIKDMNREILEGRASVGKVDIQKDLSKQLLQNYLTHLADPAAVMALGKYDRNLSTYFNVEDNLTAEMDRAKGQAGVTSFDKGGYKRTISDTLRNADAAAIEKNPDIAKAVRDAGLDHFFIQDPYVATTMRLIDAKNLVSNRKLLDFMETQGVVRQPVSGDYLNADGTSAGGKFVVEKGLAASEQRLAQNAADKMNYWYTPRQTTNYRAFVESYNRIFRNNILFRPDYYGQVFAEGMAKNYIQGVTMSDYVDTYKAMQGGYKQAIKTATGGLIPAQKMREQILAAGLQHGNSTEEMKAGMSMAKAIGREFDRSFSPKDVLNVLEHVRNVGASGENFIRQALFVNRLKQGYSVPEALMDVEKFHFDFNVRTPAMDTLRLYMPFAQHPIKTMFIAGSYVGTKPNMVNFYGNMIPRSVERAFNDPVDSVMLNAALPDYLQNRGFFLGPKGDLAELLGGQTWMYKALNRTSQTGLPTAVATGRLPIGLEILDQFTDPRALATQGPLPAFLVRSLVGVDPFSGKKVGDPYKDLGASLRSATNDALWAATGFPNTLRYLQQQFKGLVNDSAITPAAFLAMNGTAGKFAHMDNLDQSVAVKLAVLGNEQKYLYRQLVGASIKEKLGMTMDKTVAGNQPLEKLVDAVSPMGSHELLKSYLTDQSKQATVQMAEQYLTSGQQSKAPSYVEGLIGQLKSLKKTINDVNENYVELHRQQMINIRNEQLKKRQQLKDQGGNNTQAFPPLSQASSGANRSPASYQPDSSGHLVDPDYQQLQNTPAMDVPQAPPAISHADPTPVQPAPDAQSASPQGMGAQQAPQQAQYDPAVAQATPQAGYAGATPQAAKPPVTPPQPIAAPEISNRPFLGETGPLFGTPATGKRGMTGSGLVTPRKRGAGLVKVQKIKVAKMRPSLTRHHLIRKTPKL